MVVVVQLRRPSLLIDATASCSVWRLLLRQALDVLMPNRRRAASAVTAARNNNQHTRPCNMSVGIMLSFSDFEFSRVLRLFTQTLSNLALIALMNEKMKK